MKRSIAFQKVSTNPGRPPSRAAVCPSLLWFARAFALLLAASATSVGCGQARLGSSPSPSSFPAKISPSPAPTDVSQALATAHALWQAGDFEEAISTYASSARMASGAQRQEALWSLARSAYARGAAQTARSALGDLLAAAPDQELRRQALLLLGVVGLALGDDPGAEEALKQYLASDGSAAHYAHLRLAEIADRRGDHGAAVAHAQQAIALDASPRFETDARFALASYQEAAALDAAAVSTYWSLAYLPLGTPPEDRAEALWRLAGLARQNGQDSLAERALVDLARTYPWHPRALEAVQSADPPALTAAERAYVLFQHRANGEAAAAFREALADPGADTARAHYYLGILAERAGDTQAALAEYDTAADLLPPGRDDAFLGQVLWDRATVVEAVGTAEAAAAYTAVADRAAISEHAPEALFRAGLIWYREARAADAADLWERYLGAATGAEGRARALFWLAKAAQALGDVQAAARNLQTAASLATGDYYSLRALALLSGQTWPPPQAVTPPTPDWASVETWLAAAAGPEDVDATQAFFAGPAWRRPLELQEAGLEEEAKTEFASLLERATSQPWILYRFSRAASDVGLTGLAAQAAQRLAERFPEAPVGLLQLAYPAPYLDLATQYALANGISPLFLLALVRQESLYEPAAVSYVGASGLTQIVPATAAEIAAQLGDTNFRLPDLARPRVSLRFGAYYLGRQVQGFDDHLPAALAAYNGGPGNASRWLQTAGPDPDLFLEGITFAETRAYVELVLENYAHYLYAYGLAPRPAIPLP